MGITAVIVDDDDQLQDLLGEFLSQYGIQVIALPDGREVLNTIRRDTPDVIILDNILPGKDGFEILREIRQHFSTPVIILSRRSADTDRIVGLELGADDYLPKPHNPRELLARIKAVLRRTKGPGTDAAPPEPPPDTNRYLKASGLVLDRSSHTLSFKGFNEALSTMEFKVLEALMTRPGQVISRDNLLTCLHGQETSGYDRTIDLHVCNLRAKLDHLSADRNCIKTVWGTGYMFADIL